MVLPTLLWWFAYYAHSKAPSSTQHDKIIFLVAIYVLALLIELELGTYFLPLMLVIRTYVTYKTLRPHIPANKNIERWIGILENYGL